MLSDKRFYVAISGTYVLSRLALWMLGVTFLADYGWQHFHDVDLLRNRLAESILYTHAFTPFINLLAGITLKVAGLHAPTVYQVLFLLLGCGFTNALGYLLLGQGMKSSWAFAVAMAFSLTPPFIYFENLFHYEFIAASLLSISLVFFHRALVTRSTWQWLAFFAVCCLITWVRTTFHLLWLVAMLAAALCAQRSNWRGILAAFCVPAAFALLLPAKNLYSFGFFGTSSNFGANLAYTTIRQLSPSERNALVAQNKIHPISKVSVYAGPEEYAAWFPVQERRGVPVLDSFRKGNGQVNFNHWVYAEVSKVRMKDNRYYLSTYPARYASTVAKGLKKFFGPTTEWHPSKNHGPHQPNRNVLGGWEHAHNRALHSFPFRPLGIYSILLVACVAAAWRAARIAWSKSFNDCPREATILVMMTNVFYVPVLSCLITSAELARYRLLIESFIWCMTASLVMHLVQRTQERSRSRTAVAPQSERNVAM